MIGIVIALIIVGFASMFAMVHSQSGTVRRIEETQLKQINYDVTCSKLNRQIIENIDKRITNTHERIDNIITIHNANVDHYDSEINQIIARMDQITADIAELNKENISDHRDLVDIRQRYILYREPKHPNGGYTGGFVCRDDQDEQEEEHEQSV